MPKPKLPKVPLPIPKLPLPLPLPIKRDPPMLRLKFLYIMGGTFALGAGAMAAEARAAAGETITVPAGPLHGVIAIVVQVNPLKNLLRVEMLVDGNPLGVDASSPFAFVWDTRTVSDGQHLLQADSVYRNRRHSGQLTVTVSNAAVPPPPVVWFPSVTLYPSEVMP